jgi:bifunctional DNase/RNase
LAYWRGFGSDTAQLSGDESEMVVERLEPSQNKINLVLKEKTGGRRLVVAVGVAEAGSIVQDLNLPYNAPQVTAYTTARSITDGLGGKIQRVVVNNFADSAFTSKIVVQTDGREILVDAPPSDAIALALKTKAPIFANTNVLDRAGIATGR